MRATELGVIIENQTYRSSCLNLLVAAIILWNTRYLAEIAPAFCSVG